MRHGIAMCKPLFKDQAVKVLEDLHGGSRMRHFAMVFLCAVLGGCYTTADQTRHLNTTQPLADNADYDSAPSAGRKTALDPRVTIVSPASVHLTPPSSRLNYFEPTDKFLQCVPYAREVSGIEIYGDAWTWWRQAAGNFRRGHIPAVGAVLAFKKTRRLKYGHVAVVAAILDSRHILVNQANWGSDSRTRGKVHLRQPVVDVSPKNDWSQLRLMNTLGTYGRMYPAHGFIYQPNETAEAN